MLITHFYRLKFWFCFFILCCLANYFKYLSEKVSYIIFIGFWMRDKNMYFMHYPVLTLSLSIISTVHESDSFNLALYWFFNLALTSLKNQIMTVKFWQLSHLCRLHKSVSHFNEETKLKNYKFPERKTRIVSSFFRFK